MLALSTVLGFLLRGVDSQLKSARVSVYASDFITKLMFMLPFHIWRLEGPIDEALGRVCIGVEGRAGCKFFLVSLDRRSFVPHLSFCVA